MLDRALAKGLLTADEAAQAKAEPVPTARKPFPMLAAHAAEAALAEAPGRAVAHARDRRPPAGLPRKPWPASGRSAWGPRSPPRSSSIDNRTGEVLAQVGSAGHLSRERAGAVDMTAALRSPGSALKPFIYALAFEGGLAHPETLLDDRPSRYGVYAPENFDLSFQGTVTARRALQLSLNVPAVELLAAVGPPRFLARLRQAGAAIALPKEAAPGLAVGLGGLGITLTDLTRLYAGFARGGDVPHLRRRLDGEPPGRTLEPRIAEPVAAWYVADILRGAPPPDHALGPPHRLQDRHLLRLPRRLGGRLRPARDDRRLGRAAGRRRRAGPRRPRSIAAPMLFDAFARYGGEPEPVPMAANALVATTATLPPPLRHVRKDAPKTVASTAHAALAIAFPLDGSRVELGFTRPTDEGGTLALKAAGGTPPLTWLVNGAPVGAPSLRRHSSWRPDGAGFARVSVIDAGGATDSVLVRIE